MRALREFFLSAMSLKFSPPPPFFPSRLINFLFSGLDSTQYSSQRRVAETGSDFFLYLSGLHPVCTFKG